MGNDEPKRTALLGAILGALFGSLLALLCQRWARQRRLQGRKPIQVRQIVRFTLSLIPVVRQFLKLIS
ncbi:MAG: hypothetical protein H5T68_00490 [Chloroflexi bacterium]|nr:hypothetical protein [Chloroflexota bacterium]